MVLTLRYFILYKIKNLKIKRIDMKIKRKYIYNSIKKGVFLLFPMFLVAMSLYDVITIAKVHYPNKDSIYYLQFIVITFYMSCCWFIFGISNKWNTGLLLATLFFIYFMFNFDTNIKKMYEHSKCLEVSSVSCPEGVTLKGG